MAPKRHVPTKKMRQQQQPEAAPACWNAMRTLPHILREDYNALVVRPTPRTLFNKIPGKIIIRCLEEWEVFRAVTRDYQGQLLLLTGDRDMDTYLKQQCDLEGVNGVMMGDWEFPRLRWEALANFPSIETEKKMAEKMKKRNQCLTRTWGRYPILLVIAEDGIYHWRQPSENQVIPNSKLANNSPPLVEIVDDEGVLNQVFKLPQKYYLAPDKHF